MCLPAGSTDLFHQGLQFLDLTPCDAGDVPLTGKALGDFAASGISRTDHQHHFLLFCHARLT
ncbi:hypothetical protein D3C80_1904610 [compost metagenome]